MHHQARSSPNPASPGAGVVTNGPTTACASPRAAGRAIAYRSGPPFAATNFSGTGTMAWVAPEKPAEALLESAQLRAELDLLLTLALHSRERDVLRLRYGLDDGNAKTFSAVAQVMGLGMSQVRTLESRALDTLRRPHFLSRLEEFNEVEP